MTVKDKVRTDLIALSCNILKAFRDAQQSKAAEVEGIEEFTAEFNKTVEKLSQKEKISEKRWAKLQAAMPEEVRPYFSDFRTGPYDLSNDSDFMAFISGIVSLARQYVPAETQAELMRDFVIWVMSSLDGE